MDQCVSMGPNSVGLMEFNGQHCILHRLHCAAPLYFVVADLRAGKNTIDILRSLNDCFPMPSSEAQVCVKPRSDRHCQYLCVSCRLLCGSIPCTDTVSGIRTTAGRRLLPSKRVIWGRWPRP